ncbi:MAG: SDR family oxidoreductase [Deltaproteobacteria bacterium]|jgi:nucleoside-diphosphate-sugar epimerase|nr:SDR family oxidoreductase [Deltaproteobacteria bacterium]
MTREFNFKHITIVGCGDIGVRVSLLLQKQTCHVKAMARSGESAERLGAYRIEPILADLDDRDSLKKLNLTDQLVFYLAPPPGGGTVDSRMRNFCQAIGSGQVPIKLLYISTSGVYGDCAGSWVTEDTPVHPQTSRAHRRLDAETTLCEWGQTYGVSTPILRVTGIYGPGRLPIARLQQRHPVLKEDESPLTNRIHAEDLAAICLDAARHGQHAEVYNVSDGRPGSMTEYFNTIADLLGIPRPPQISMADAKTQMTPMMLSYLCESRRMANNKMLSDLRVTLQYPDLVAGLKQAIDQLAQPNMGYYGSMKSQH